MSNYTKATNFAAKDSLPSGNAGKIIKGTEIDNEYNAIASAISSKADTNSPTFTGTPLAPTASSSNNTTQIATTAFVQAAITSAQSTILQAAYPVGSIYVNATSSTNPGTLLGFGTWTAFGAGRMMVGFNASDTLFDTAEETGGSKDAIVVSHTHTATSTVTDPGHSHTANVGNSNAAQDRFGRYTNAAGTLSTNSATTGITVATTVASSGSSGTNANLPPYITVYMWKRIS